MQYRQFPRRFLAMKQKSSQHGKRADAIVKGMLQHSRPGEQEQKPTDINALTDEYFRLAYHGQRAKDKSFKAAMNRDFDPEAGIINIVPQEIRPCNSQHSEQCLLRGRR